ncbi:MAG: DUF1932 domain-containing protein [Sphingomonadales bacterium]
MTAPGPIALIGYGEVGRILDTDLAQAGVADIRHYDIKFDPPGGAPDAVRGAALIISAVTAAQTVAAARSVLPGLDSGTFFLDLNSASPAAKQQAAALIDAAGGRYVEAAVMAPVAPKRIATPLLLGGRHGGDFLTRFGGLGFDARLYADHVGKAAAAKLCRSVMVKGVEALLTESLLAARHHGVEDEVLGSLANLLPAPDWPERAHYMISRAVEHGARRAEEMREAAATVAEAQFDPIMAEATAARQDWAADYRHALGAASLNAMLDAILSRIEAENNGDPS